MILVERHYATAAINKPIKGKIYSMFLPKIIITKITGNTNNQPFKPNLGKN